MNFDTFIKNLIDAAGWELRYNNQRFPYAYLPNGFGKGEKDIKLHFAELGGQVKITGVIENSHVIRVRRPSVKVSLYTRPDAAATYIKEHLIPVYYEAWKEAQPKLVEYYGLRDEYSKTSNKLRWALHFTKTFDPERGIEVYKTKDVEMYLNSDLTVSMNITVHNETALRICELLRQDQERHEDQFITCPACNGEGQVNNHPCGLCKQQGVVSKLAAKTFQRWKA